MLVRGVRLDGGAAFWAAAALVAAITLVAAVTPGSATPRHVDDWYRGSWRFTAPMVGLQRGHLVRRTAAAGVVKVSSGAQGLLVSMQGFPGVSSAVVSADRTPLEVDFQTPDAGQGIGRWQLILANPPAGSLRFYDASRGAERPRRCARPRRSAPHAATQSRAARGAGSGSRVPVGVSSAEDHETLYRNRARAFTRRESGQWRRPVPKSRRCWSA